MSDLGIQPVAEPNQAGEGMSQMQRVTSTFSAPSKTFQDIKAGNRSWWLPFVLFAVFGYILFAAITFKIGMQQVVDNQMHLNPKQEEKLAQAPPASREMTAKISLYVTEGVFIANPVLVLVIAAVISLVLWGTINFVFGGKASFGAVFAVWFFANLPGILKPILGTIVIFAGAAPETFNIKAYAPTNVAAFLNPLETNAALYALATSLDVVTIWTLFLMGMGLAIVAGVKRSSGYAAVFGWWIITIIFSVGIAAVTG
jgi:hypothetical protein